MKKLFTLITILTVFIVSFGSCKKVEPKLDADVITYKSDTLLRHQVLVVKELSTDKYYIKYLYNQFTTDSLNDCPKKLVDVYESDRLNSVAKPELILYYKYIRYVDGRYQMLLNTQKRYTLIIPQGYVIR